jgi:hypothetical protein
MDRWHNVVGHLISVASYTYHIACVCVFVCFVSPVKYCRQYDIGINWTYLASGFRICAFFGHKCKEIVGLKKGGLEIRKTCCFELFMNLDVGD